MCVFVCVCVCVCVWLDVYMSTCACAQNIDSLLLIFQVTHSNQKVDFHLTRLHLKTCLKMHFLPSLLV